MVGLKANIAYEAIIKVSIKYYKILKKLKYIMRLYILIIFLFLFFLISLIISGLYSTNNLTGKSIQTLFVTKSTSDWDF